MSPRLTLLALLCAFSARSYAFQIGEHEQVTRQAFAELVKCFPQLATQVNPDTLVQADDDEDLNLIEKELFFSHFYNPNKKINLWWRGSSADRIENLKPDLLQCRVAGSKVEDQDVAQLGHAIHHFQDMAVPAHVVPVNHSMWDGFESYGFAGDISSEWNCQQLASSSPDEVGTILQETAQQTVNAIAAWQVEVLDESTHKPRVVQGQEFWIESNDDSFGAYGSMGNNFGHTEFDTDSGTQFVDENVFKQFKQQQLKLAVRATLRGLIWALQPHN